MARRSLKPQLNQIRAWVRQGRTDAWIAHQLEVSASELREFRKQHDLTPDGEDAGSEVDLRDEIEAEIEAASAEEEAEGEIEEEQGEEDEGDEEADGEEAKPAPARKARKRKADKAETEGSEDDGDQGDGGPRPKRRRRRGRRGGRGRRKEIEATFDHGERDGYGLWLDASVKDNPVYKEHWAGKRDVSVRIDADQIVIRRAGESPGGDSDD